MARFFKHVGEHNGKKVVIVQRAIPSEDHMCSVLYTQIIPSQYHDDIMKILESVEGQSANEFVDILRRRNGSNGLPLLDTVAREGYLKKVPTNAVIVKPNAKSAIRLDELNKLLWEQGAGEQAQQRLQELENQRGFKDPVKQEGYTGRMQEVADAAPAPAGDGVLTDSDLAQINIEQARTMKAEAERLLAEASRLEEEAMDLNPSLKLKRKTSGRKTKKSPA